jgi:hypothetical protein
VFTFFGVVAASFLLWLSTQFDPGTEGYWARIGVIAAAGLTLVLAQVFGGWTKWGRPLISIHVLLFAFLPALLVGGWILLAAQPDDNWFQSHVSDWSNDLHVARLVRHLRAYVFVIAFGLGAVLAFAVDTRGPKRDAAEAPAAEPEPETAVVEPETVAVAATAAPPTAPEPWPEPATEVVPPDETATVVAAPASESSETETNVLPPRPPEGERPPDNL